MAHNNIFYFSSIGLLLKASLVLVVGTASAAHCGTGDLECGSRCYNPTIHVCASVDFLCPIEYPLQCGPSCYNPTQYTCVNGQLQPTGQTPTQTQTPTPTPTPNACPPNDLICGTRCYSPLTHVCTVASNLLCPITAPYQCGQGSDVCYSPSQYSCIASILEPPAPTALQASYSDIGTTANETIVKWWQWIINSPIVPTSDPKTGRPAALLASGNIDCSGYIQNDYIKPVIFFSGVLLPSPTPVSRTCIGTIPLGTYIYFPVLNGETNRPNPIPLDNPLSFDFLNCLSPLESTGLREKHVKVTVDGNPIHNIINTFALSQPHLFIVQPLTPPMIKIGGSFFPGERWIQASGYQVLLAPLPAGQHTVRIQVDAVGVCSKYAPPGILKLDVQYTFVVA